MKLDLNTEQLEFLQFILDNFEYNDEEERALKDSIESQLYEVREQDLLIAMKIASSHINPLGEQLIMDTSKLSDVSVNVNLTFYQLQILRELAIEEKACSI